MKTEQDIKNKWMEESGLPIVSDDEKYAYIQWLENEHLASLKQLQALTKPVVVDEEKKIIYKCVMCAMIKYMEGDGPCEDCSIETVTK